MKVSTANTNELSSHVKSLAVFSKCIDSIAEVVTRVAANKKSFPNSASLMMHDRSLQLSKQLDALLSN
jgi:hypothetical protein